MPVAADDPALLAQQPEAVAETIGDRVRHGHLVLEGLGMTDDEIRDLRRIVLLASGTSYHACVVGRYVIEEWARVTSSGDLAEVPELSDAHPVWPQVTSTRDNCLGQRCSEFAGCHVVAARSRGGELGPKQGEDAGR